ncbi:hypothetical protein AALP_AAs55237U000100, partial [Arabis alpina]
CCGRLLAKRYKHYGRLFDSGAANESYEQFTRLHRFESPEHTGYLVNE